LISRSRQESRKLAKVCVRKSFPSPLEILQRRSFLIASTRAYHENCRLTLTCHVICRRIWSLGTRADHPPPLYLLVGFSRYKHAQMMPVFIFIHNRARARDHRRRFQVILKPRKSKQPEITVPPPPLPSSPLRSNARPSCSGLSLSLSLACARARAIARCDHHPRVSATLRKIIRGLTQLPGLT
jgi:hypothetical protein